MKSDLATLQTYQEAFFKIPKFQRTYAWTELEWENFWRTISERALNLNNPNQTMSPIFMGAIVLQELGSERVDAKEFKRFAIVDGQQRFVTIAVFLATLRDFYFGAESKHFLTWSRRFLKVDLNLMGTLNKERLDLQDKDNEIYKKLIGQKSESEWKELIKGTHPLCQLYKFFWDKLSKTQHHHLELISEKDEIDLSEDDNIESIVIKDKEVLAPFLQPNSERVWGGSTDLFNPETLTNIVDNNMKFAAIEIQSTDNEIAFEVFETLNAKGQKLEEVAKFRNGYFMLHPENSDSIHGKYWLPMETAAVNDETLSTFFHEETTRRFGFTPKEKIYQVLMSQIKNGALASALEGKTINEEKRRSFVVNEFEDLRESLKSFMIVHKGSDELEGQNSEGKEYGRLLDSLKKMVAGPATPLLLDVIKWSQRNRTDKDIQTAVNEILKTVQNLLARRLLAGVKPQQLRSLLADVPKNISEQLRQKDRSRACTVDNLRFYNARLQEMMVKWGPERYPTNDFLLANPIRDVYNATGRKLALFSVLWELERALDSEKVLSKVPTYGGNAKGSWTIEHVLPQGTKLDDKNAWVMNNQWRTYWTELGVKQPEFEFQKNVQAIGNLTFLINTTNSHMGNESFAKKKEIFNNATRVALSDYIKKTDNWTPDQIEKRSVELLNLAIACWSYPNT